MLDSTRELVDVIDDNNETIGTMERREAYAHALAHRIVHVMVVKGESLFLVRRARTVRYMPGRYCTSAGGHVAAGESFEQGALRELEEEIGLRGPLEHVETFSFVHDFRVAIALFVLRIEKSEGELRLNPSEVLDGDFYSVERVRALDRSMFHPQLQDCIDKTWSYLNV